MECGEIVQWMEAVEEYIELENRAIEKAQR